ncbi:hypothetical protein [Natronorarus salvus]
MVDANTSSVVVGAFATSIALARSRSSHLLQRQEDAHDLVKGAERS